MESLSISLSIFLSASGSLFGCWLFLLVCCFFFFPFGLAVVCFLEKYLQCVLKFFFKSFSGG